ncbi:MAG: DUF4168 domain-containing protein [Spiribacter sp.]|jgi:GTP1/Obg family GTP-binding protein|nr:DUF4168 domain-containing protein [Spiribacter sp.]MDR9489638.1 DUF4168 domain-containing protein [Spiribacter sp.]
MAIRNVITRLSLLGLLMFSLSAIAQDASFSDQQINQFVTAKNAVMEIRDDYVQRIEATDDRDEAMALEQEANQMMVQAVEDTGLTVDMYSEIAQSATQDTALAERINSME